MNEEKLSIQRSYEITYRAKKNNNKKIIQGYTVVFDRWAEVKEWGECWSECIRKGAFTQSLVENSILALYNHDFNNVLARKDVNMKLIEEDKGLYFEIELPDTTQANDLYELIDKGIVNQCSFGGFVRKNVWSYDSEGNPLREILDIDLVEITITPIPVYEVTEAEVKRCREIRGNNKQNNLNFEEVIIKSREEIKKLEEFERSL